MPKETRNIKEFLKLATDSKNAKWIKLKKAKRNGKEGIKFKLRMGTYLYTLFQSESSKIQKVRDALPPGLTKKAVDYQENNA